MNRWLLSTLLFSLACMNANAVDRKPISEIDIHAMTQATQKVIHEEKDKHLAIVWWTPVEFWQHSFTKVQDESVRKSLVDAFSGASLIAITQADIEPMGVFDFYSKDEIEKHLVITFTDAQGHQHKVLLKNQISPELHGMLGFLKPMLAGAMGNLGNNMDFFVIDDNADGKRLLDPYQKGLLSIDLQDRKGTTLHSEIEMPLNPLFVPRKCPNGKDADVSWKFCPWDGTPLKD